jgi:hypothetical protein
MPLDADETAKYINHRLRRAALGAPLEFPRDVTDLIHARSRGVPRIVNVMCDATLVFGYAEERRQIDLSLMREVIKELEATGVLPAGEPAPAGSGVIEAPPAVTARLVTAGPAGAAVAAAPAVPDVAAVTSPAVPLPLAGRAAALMDQRVAALDHREQALLQRERELADQRRVLAEEYRLLRQQRPAPMPGVPPSGGPRTGLAVPRVQNAVFTPEYRRPVQRQTAARRFDASRSESAWGRFKRFWVGVAASAMEN